jgi:MFS family permease
MSEPTADAVTDRATPLRGNRDFNLLWLSGTLSDLGSETSLLAIPLLVLSITGSPAQAGVVGTLSAVVRGVARLPGGALADRWNRRRVMLVSDVVRLVLFALLGAAVVTGHLSMPLIFAVVCGEAVFDVLFSPAEIAAVAQLVPAQQLPDAFARNEARSYGASMLGPPLGGLLYGIGRVAPFLFDAFSFLVSFVAVAAIRRPVQSERDTAPVQSVASDIVEGVRHVLRSPFLRAVLLVATPVNFGVTGALFTVTVGLRQHGVSATVIGLAQGAIAVGGLLGAMVAGRLQRRASVRALVIWIDAVLLGCVSLAGLLLPHLLLVVPLAAGLFLSPAINAALFGRLAATTPDHLQARVTSVIFLGASAAASLAPLAAGVVIEYVSAAVAMQMCAFAMLVATVGALVSRGLREAD